MTMHTRSLTIGALAKATGVSAPTIRYYEEIGLIPRASRSPGGQRAYDETDIERLTFIRRCRDFGFSIDQVRLLADLSVSSDRDCAEVGDIARAHLDEVRRKLAELRELEKSLKVFVDRCETLCSGGPGRDCVVFTDITMSRTVRTRT